MEEGVEIPKNRRGGNRSVPEESVPPPKPFFSFSFFSFSLFRREEDSSKLKRRFVLFIRIPTVENSLDKE